MPKRCWRPCKSTATAGCTSTQRASIPLRDGFLNLWHASIPVGAATLELDGACTAQLRGGLIYSNQVFFDRSALLRAIERARAPRE